MQIPQCVLAKLSQPPRPQCDGPREICPMCGSMENKAFWFYCAKCYRYSSDRVYNLPTCPGPWWMRLMCKSWGLVYVYEGMSMCCAIGSSHSFPVPPNYQWVKAEAPCV